LRQIAAGKRLGPSQHAFMRGVAVEQARYGMRANCVCPGPIDTAWTHKETGPMLSGFRRGGRWCALCHWWGTTIAKGPVGDLVPKSW